MILKTFNTLNYHFFRQEQNSGRHSICIRIKTDIDKDYTHVSTGIVIEKKEYWQDKKLKGYKGAKEDNDRLDNIVVSLKHHFNVLSTLQEFVTGREVRAAYKGTPQRPKTTVLAVFKRLWDEKIEETKQINGIQPRAADEYKRAYNYLRDFLAENYDVKLLADNFHKKHVKEFYSFLRKRNDEEVAWKKITKLQTAFTNALEDRIIKYNSIKSYKIPIKRKKKHIKYLYPNEIERIKAVEIPVKHIDRERDVFLLQCSLGMSDGDFRFFLKKPKQHIVEKEGKEVIIFQREKTSAVVEVPVFKSAREYLDKYNYKVPIVAQGNRNLYLKAIGDFAEIERIKLTTHVARRSFATILLNFEKVPLYAVSNLLGHADMSITIRHYAAIIPKSVLKEVEHLL